MKNPHDYKNNPHSSIYRYRFYLLIGLLLFVCLALFWRMIQLSILKRNFLVKQNEARILRTVNIPAHRGIILDRNGHPLAVSTEVNSVWVNPKIFEASEAQLKSLAKWTKIPETAIEERVKKNAHREFVYLKRGLSPHDTDEIKALKIPGVFFQKEYRRYYPEGEIFAHVLGFTNVDDQGQEGLELSYNQWLSGTPGKKEVLKDRMGNVIADVNEIKKPQEGHHLTLSLDNRIQYLAYASLKEVMEKYQVKSGMVVVMNPKSGEILAMVNWPSYNPNDRDNRSGKQDGRYRNRAVTDVFEPGSTIKSFTVVNALESKKYTPDTKIDTEKGSIQIGRKTIKDLSRYGVITLTEAVKKSSEVAIIKITLSLTPESLWNVLKRVGFGEKTESGFSGEVGGSLVARKKWRNSELVTLSYGYGLSVTALQLARAYSILAAEGMKYPVTFIKQDQGPEGEQVISPKIARQMITMLESVTEKGGTGQNATIPGYRVSGKTGTAYVAQNRGYNEKQYTASFIGMAPASNPELVVAVIMRDVTGFHHFGGQVAAPVFTKVMGGALRILNVPPDAVPAESSHQTARQSE